MELLKFRFWIKLGLMMATTYIMTFYIVMPSRNQCQMTFMMEPPRFIPIPIDEDSIPGQKSSNQQNVGYKLYMYSELGFPLEADLRRDLKDSMPVLFIPGNAGSYQQVRSLASTCIRHQLQSLDAYKFIFYTIDFQAQLSGISGELIEKQIDFVQAALNQISLLHPTDTNGIIVIGHSVGGFLSKALFARSSFDQNLVPMLINLASPLTQPYLNFDDKMRDIYVKANAFWSQNSSAFNTVSISISGGRSDRLVPLHSSLDSGYDLSLSTSSMDDVWLTADHVCITWCRELMHKLASLLSQVMDKKDTKLISNKNVIVDRIIENLLTPVIEHNMTTYKLPQRAQKIIKPHNFKLFKTSYSLNRHELIQESIALNLTNSDSSDFLVWLEHIDKLKESGLAGCSNLEFDGNSSHATCIGKINLLDFATKIPSKKYEPKKKLIYLANKNFAQLNYLLIDFVSNSRVDYSKRNRVPEILHMHARNATKSNSIYFPSMLEFYYGKIYGYDNGYIRLNTDKMLSSVMYLNYRLDNLKHESQFYKLKLESRNCASDDGSPRESIVLSMLGHFIVESSQPDEGKSTVIINLSSQEFMKMRNGPKMNLDPSLKIFIDGTCENAITLDFDWFSLIDVLIQKHLSKILTYCCYFSYTSIVWHSIRLLLPGLRTLSYLKSSLIWLLWFFSNVVVHVCMSQGWRQQVSNTHLSMSTDHVIQFLLIILISSGISSSIEYFISRIVDIAIILNNVQSIIGDKINMNSAKTGTNSSSINDAGNLYENGRLINHTRKQPHASLDFDWIVLGLAFCGSLIFSEALLSVCMLFIFIKSGLNLTTVLNSSAKSKTNRHTIDERQHDFRSKRLYELAVLQDITLSAASLCALGLLANIPAALLVLNNAHIFDDLLMILTKKQSDYYFFVTLISTFMVMQCSETIESMVSDNNNTMNKAQRHAFIRKFSIKALHLFAVLPIIGIDGNIRHINMVQLIMMTWLKCMLTGSRNKLQLKLE